MIFVRVAICEVISRGMQILINSDSDWQESRWKSVEQNASKSQLCDHCSVAPPVFTRLEPASTCTSWQVHHVLPLIIISIPHVQYIFTTPSCSKNNFRDHLLICSIYISCTKDVHAPLLIPEPPILIISIVWHEWCHNATDRHTHRQTGLILYTGGKIIRL